MLYHHHKLKKNLNNNLPLLIGTYDPLELFLEKSYLPNPIDLLAVLVAGKIFTLLKIFKNVEFFCKNENITF